MDEISQIKQKLNIVDVVGNYIELKKAGRNYKAVCPFHSEKTPSFMVSPELQIFKCFGCGENGDIFTFVQKMEGVEFSDALTQLAEKAGVKLESRRIDPHSKEKKRIVKINNLSTKFYHHLLTKHDMGKQALRYLKKERKLTKKTINEFNLGYAPNNWNILYKFLARKNYSDNEIEMSGNVIKKRSGEGYIDKFRGRVIFPLTGIDGKVVGFTGRTLLDRTPKYLNTPETLVFHKSSFIYGLDKAKTTLKKKGALLAEGQLDVITAHQAGINNVIATSGTSLTRNQLIILSRYTNDLAFAFDSDTAGQNATLRAIELAEKEGFNIKIAIIPDVFADLDELIRNGKAQAKKIIKDSVPIYDFFLAVSLKNHNKKTAIGKKKIIEELAPKLAKISSKVVLDHYTKKISKELDIKEETLLSIIKSAEKEDFEKKLSKTISKNIKERNIETIQEYMLSLIFNAELELAQNMLYKLGRGDFTHEELETIFSSFKDYAIGRKRKFDLKYFISMLDDNLANRAQKIYLQDLGLIADDEKALENELTSTFNRLKRETVTRELRELKEKLNQAELEKNTKEIKKLSEQVYKFSKQKNQYD